jgi:cobalt-zinc-cadmium efflux system membrane fusion protein
MLVIGVCGIVLMSCGSDEAAPRSTTAVAAETGHEGHNHAPGEHGVAAAIESGHEGHNHAPGEHGGVHALSVELDWCEEHAVPESVCTRCQPERVAGFKASGDWCAGHDLPESHCRACNPGLTFPQEEIIRTQRREVSGEEISVSLHFRPNATVCATDNALIQFATVETAGRCGITVETARSARFESTGSAPAEVVFDEARTSVVSTSVPALVTRWLVEPGERVRQGDVLAILRSPEIAGLKAGLLSSQAAADVQRREYERHRQMRERDLISQADFESQQAVTAQAEAAFSSARGLLLAAGLDEADLEDVVTHGSVSNQFVLRASVDGALIERRAQVGTCWRRARLLHCWPIPRPCGSRRG